MQRYDNNATRMTKDDAILSKPEKDDSMFFIIGKKSAKEKYMFMCHLGKQKVWIFCCLLYKIEMRGFNLK